jgi:hypothetical protein
MTAHEERRAYLQRALVVVTDGLHDLRQTVMAPSFPHPNNRKRWQFWTGPMARGELPPGSGGDDYFGGARSMDDVNALVTDGWPEGVERITALVPNLLDARPAVDRRAWQVARRGKRVRPQAVARGDFRRMWLARNPAGIRWGARTVAIVTPWGGHHAVGTDRMLCQAAAGIMVASALEDLGCTVGLYGVAPKWANSSEDHPCTTVVTLKAPGEPMDVHRVVTVAAHPAVYRCWGIPACLASEGQVDGGMGIHPPSNALLLSRVALLHDEHRAIPSPDIVLHRIQRPEGVMPEVERALASVGALDYAP